MSRAKKNWIQDAIKHPGALHKQLGIAQGRKISEKRLHQAENSSDPLLRKRAHLADTLRHLHHGPR